jgi:hypothetical protein
MTSHTQKIIWHKPLKSGNSRCNTVCQSKLELSKSKTKNRWNRWIINSRCLNSQPKCWRITLYVCLSVCVFVSLLQLRVVLSSHVWATHPSMLFFFIFWADNTPTPTTPTPTFGQSCCHPSRLSCFHKYSFSRDKWNCCKERETK